MKDLQYLFVFSLLEALDLMRSSYHQEEISGLPLPRAAMIPPASIILHSAQKGSLALCLLAPSIRSVAL